MGEGSMNSEGCQLCIWTHRGNLPSKPPVAYSWHGCL